MLVYFDEIVRDDYENTQRIEKILVNPDAIVCAKMSKAMDENSIIFLTNGKTIEVNGDLELLREFIGQASISSSNGSISSSNNRQGSGRPNSKNGS